MADYNPGTERVRPTAAPNIQSEKARPDAQGGPVDQLLAALGSDNTQRTLAQFDQQHAQKKLQEQQGKFDWYVEQFQQDYAGGAVSEAQVKSRFPETVPVIASRIAEAVGQNEGRKAFQGVVDEIAGDDALRLDTGARNAHIAKRRAEITAQVGQGNDFFGAGLVSSIDKLTRQYEQNWSSETAAYHQKIQVEQFSGGVVDALNSGDPAAGLLALDEKFGKSSSLNNLERNAAVVATAIDHAFTADKKEVLDAIPQRFLNADSKAALIKAKVQITERRMSDFRSAEYLEGVKRDRSTRDSKVAIVQAVSEGKAIDPAAYRNDPDAFQFAMVMREAPRVPQSASAAEAQRIRSTILSAASADGGGSEEQTIDAIMANRGLNPADKQALVGEVSKLREGNNLMRDDDVRQQLSDFLRPALDVLGRSTNSIIQALVAGKNLEMQVTRGFERDLMGAFRAHYDDPATQGKWPAGSVKRALIREAVDRAEARLEKLTKLGASTEAAPAAAPKSPPVANNPAAARPTPSAATPLPKGVTRLN